MLLPACDFVGTVQSHTVNHPQVFDATWMTYSDDLAYHSYDRLVVIAEGDSPGSREIVYYTPNGAELDRQPATWAYRTIAPARQLGYAWLADGSIIRKALVWFDGYFGESNDTIIPPFTHTLEGTSSLGYYYGVVDIDVDTDDGIIYALTYYDFYSGFRAVVMAFSDDDLGNPSPIAVADVDANGDSLGFATAIAVDETTKRIFVARDQTLTAFNASLNPLFTGPAVPSTQIIRDLDADHTALVVSSYGGGNSYQRLFYSGSPSSSWDDLEQDIRTTPGSADYLLAGRRLPDGTIAGCTDRNGEVWGVHEDSLKRHQICE